MILFREELNSSAAFTAIGTLAALVAGSAAWVVYRRRPSPIDREKKRRESVYMRGRVGDATILEIGGGFIQYSYSIGGVEYVASQDISGMEPLLPDDPSPLIGPATVRYLASNPANSMVLSERWSGLRARRAPAKRVPAKAS